MNVCFVVGQEDTKEFPGDTPEAYWRTLLPARRLGTAVVVGRAGAAERATAADVIWIFQPTCSAAASLAEVGRQLGKPVVVDWAEDVWRRSEQDNGYTEAQIRAAERAMEAATVIVGANRRLAEVYAEHGRAAVVETVLPLADWTPGKEDVPAVIAWWSDGRQKAGFETVAPGLAEVMGRTGCKMVHVQFTHQKPLVEGLDKEAARARAARLHAYFWNDLGQTVEANLRVFKEAVARAAVSVDAYAPGEYRRTVSDVSILRAAALALPTVTTRQDDLPPGCIGARPGEWADTICELLEDRDRRRRLGGQARAWAETRSTYEGYEALLQEVGR